MTCANAISDMPEKRKKNRKSGKYGNFHIFHPCGGSLSRPQSRPLSECRRLSGEFKRQTGCEKRLLCDWAPEYTAPHTHTLRVNPPQ